MKKGLLIVAGVLVLILLVFGGSCVSRYNEMVSLREGIDGKWTQIEDVLQRRNDLIPSLVSTVKGYASQEEAIFENVARARAGLAGATNVSETVEADIAMRDALEGLLAIEEDYPQLKTDQTYIRLKDELAGAMESIAAERENYNESVRFYNTFVKQFPNSSIAGLFGIQPEEIYFEAVEVTKERPGIESSDVGGN